MVIEAENCNGFIPKTKKPFADYKVQLFDKGVLAFRPMICTLLMSTCCQRNNPMTKDKTILTRKGIRTIPTQLSVTGEHLVPVHSSAERYEGSIIQVVRLTFTLLLHLYSF